MLLPFFRVSLCFLSLIFKKDRKKRTAVGAGYVGFDWWR